MITFFFFSVHLQLEETNLRDYVLHSVVNNFIRGNFTPTSNAERPCNEDQPIPYFLPKHRSKLIPSDFRTLTVDSSSVYFKPKYRSLRGERSAFRRPKSLRYRSRFLPSRVVAGPLEARSSVMLHWSLTDAVHMESGESSVVFRWVPLFNSRIKISKNSTSRVCLRRLCERYLGLHWPA